MSGPRSRDEDATQAAEKGACERDSQPTWSTFTMDAERVGQGKPSAFLVMKFWLKGERLVGQEESFYVVMKHVHSFHL